MGVQQSNSKNWKDFLLKSSLPLEQIVSEKLENNGLYVEVEYPYFRPNEHNINTEFSVDLFASASLEPDKNYKDTEVNFIKDSALQLLVECKYNSPGTKWVFSSVSKDGDNFTSGVSYISNQVIGRLPRDLEHPICKRGIVLTNNGADPNSITHGLNQLRYAMPNLIRSGLGVGDGKDKPPYFMSLLLVTTADLYILKSGQNLETYQIAQSLENVAEQSDIVIVKHALGPHLQAYFEHQLSPRNDPLGLRNPEQQPQWRVKDLLPDAIEVIVVHLDAFEAIVNFLVYTAHLWFTDYLNSNGEWNGPDWTLW